MDRLRAFLKYLLSFTKSHWELGDYPLRVVRQEHQAGTPAYRAQIIHWWTAVGLGDSREEALANLQQHLDAFLETSGRLPRPGTRVPLELAASSGIERYRAIADEFLLEVFGWGEDDPVFISDESSLDDFEGVLPSTELAARIEARFGIDISDIEDGNLVRIFERIEASRA